MVQPARNLPQRKVEKNIIITPKFDCLELIDQKSSLKAQGSSKLNSFVLEIERSSFLLNSWRTCLNKTSLLIGLFLKHKQGSYHGNNNGADAERDFVNFALRSRSNIS